MAEHKNHIPFIITLLVIGWGLLIVVNALRADWSGPNAEPPNGNPSSFLTSGSNAETKTGPLTISNNFFVTGNVNLGSTSTPTSARLVIDPYTNASIDAGSGFIRTGYIPVYNYDVINKAYLYSSLEASSYWILSTSTNSLYPTSTSWKVGIGTTNPGTAKLAVMGGNVGIGTTSPENSDGWGMVLDVYGSGHAKSIVTAGTIQTGVFSHTSGYYGAPAGGIIGTKSNHPLSFITNATTKMTISSSGNVGIGTTSPGGKLHVYATAQNNRTITADGGNTAVFLVSNLGTGGYNPLSQAGDAGIIYQGNAINTGSLVIGQWSNSARGIRIDSTGNVGIGTTSPAKKLDVVGDIQASGSIYGTYAGNISATNVSAGTFASSTGGGNFTFPANLYINGNVGIGTTNPGAKLTVAQSDDSHGIDILGYDDMSSNYLKFYVSDLGHAYGRTASGKTFFFQSGGNLDFKSATGYGVYFNYGQSDDISFLGGTSNPVIIKGNGNVGIGTTNPSQKLHVVGDARFDSPIIEVFGSAETRTFKNLVSYEANGSVNGAQVIQTNIPQDDHTFIQTDISIWELNANKDSCVITMGGYWSTEANGSFQALGYTNLCPTKYQIRIGRNNSTGKTAIILGDTGSVWSYPRIQVLRMMASYGVSDSYADGWTIAPTTDLSGYVNLRTVPDKSVLGGLVQSTVNDSNYFTGNVGIGTTTPGYKLDVTGQINASSGLCIAGDCKTAWSQVAGMTNPMTTLGDIIYGGASGAPTRLAGSAGFLKSTGAAAPSWSALAASDIPALDASKITSGTFDAARIPNLDASKITSGTFAIARGGTNSTATPTAGAVAYGTGSAYAFSAAGTASQVLISGGTGSPTWSNIASLLTSGTNISISGTTNATIATVNNPTFSTSVSTPILTSSGAIAIKPGANSATAIQLQNAAGTSILNVDTTNSRIGIATTSPAYTLDVLGDVRFSGTLQGGSVPWSRLTSFPSACSAGNAVTGVGSSLTCSAFMANPMTTLGDIVYGGASGAPTRLAGSAGFLKSTGAAAPSWSALAAADIPALDASKITSGTFNAARIPNLDASKITSGTFDAARIPSLDASKITSGTFGVARGGTGLSSVATGTILYATTSNTFVAMAPTAANQVLRSTGANALQFGSLVATDIPSLDASKITSGTFGIARGGTNSTATPTAGAVAYGTGSAYAFSAAGTASQVLISGGTGSPTWSNIASLLTSGTNISISGTTNATIATVNNPTFSTSVSTPILTSSGAIAIKPGANSTTAIQLQNAAGTSILNVDTTNARVGIGSTAPAYALDINGTAGFQTAIYGNAKAVLETGDAFLRINQSNQFGNGIWIGSSDFKMGGGTLRIGSQGGAGEVEISGTSGDATTRVAINGNANANSWFNTGGNVGIGTTSPAKKLHVIGDIQASGALYGTYGGTIAATNVSAGKFASTTGGGDFSFPGKVGIGTTSPATTLEVSGKIKTGSFQLASGAVPGYVLTADNAGNATWQPLIPGLPTATTGQTLYFDGNNWTVTSNLYNDDSRVGIGTTSPQAKLHVNIASGAYACNGIAKSCYSFLTQSACIAQSGCEWSSEYIDCSELPQDECYSTSGCQWLGGVCKGSYYINTCIGTARQCSSFTDQTGCQGQNGCSWIYVSDPVAVFTGGRVGIGTTNPATTTALDVNGVIQGKFADKYSGSTSRSGSAGTTTLNTGKYYPDWFCALGFVDARETDSSTEQAKCNVTLDANNQWILEAIISGYSDQSVYCGINCIRL